MLFPPAFPRARAATAALLFALALAGRAGAQFYTVVDLAPMAGGDASSAYGINNAGQVVGRSSAGGIGTAVLWNPLPGGAASAIPLGTLGSAPSSAYGINDAGQIVGAAGSGAQTRAVLFSSAGGAPADLGSLPGQPYAAAYDINNGGQISGRAYGGALGAPAQPALWTLGGGAPSVVALAGGPGSAVAVSVNGLAVGLSGTRAALWNPATGVTFLGSGADARGVNALGQVVGQGNGGASALLWTVGPGGAVTTTDLGNLGLPSAGAFSINSAGQVVGNSLVVPANPDAAAPTHGFLWTTQGGMRDLNLLVAPGSGVADLALSAGGGGTRVNEWGQISAVGTVNGQTRAVRLDPTAPNNFLSGATQNTKLVAGMNYALTPVFSNPLAGGRGTTVTLRDGIVGSGGNAVFGRNRDLGLSFASFVLASATIVPASDMLDIINPGGDRFTLQLSYDPAAPAGLVEILWLDPRDGIWKPAVQGNSNGGVGLSFAGERDYDPAQDNVLGRFGVNPANHTAWVVLDHDGLFVVVPEPGAAAASLAFAGLGLVGWRRVRKG